MEYMHEKNVSHRDLKLENIMIDKYAHIRLIDFGFSSLNTMMTTCCGSIPYCAPEILSGQNYTKSADIWSLGIILYAILQGCLPFYHSNINMLAFIICSNEPYFTPSMDPSARDLIIKMLIKDPEQRITLNEIKEHPFVKQSKLFQINYKQLFSPTPLENDNYKRSSLKIPRQVNSNALIQQINGSIDHLHIDKSSTCLTFNFALTQHQKNCYHMRSRRTSNDFSKSEPKELSLPDGEKAIKVACGDTIFVLSQTGRVFRYSLETSDEPFVEVKELLGIKINEISGTRSHFFAISDDGRVFGLGSNENGKLGMPKDADHFEVIKSFGRSRMRVCYNKPCKLLIDKGLKKTNYE